MESRLVIGCMTGTSMDGLDAAALRIHGRGLSMRASMVGSTSRSFPEEAGFPSVFSQLADGGPCDAGQIAAAAHEFSAFHGEVCAELIASCGGERPDLIAVHGQTVFHRPPLSWQVFNPWPLAHRLGCVVVSDLRGADLAAGGQGAPITPLADWVLFRREGAVAVVNLGGFCNVTLLPGAGRAEGVAGIRARDVCACNHLLNGVARAVLGTGYDVDGRAAASGRVCEESAAELERELMAQSGAGRSLGSGDERLRWIERWRERIGVDTARTAVEALARVIAGACEGAAAVLLAGGGVKNRALAERLGALLPRARVETTAGSGIPVEQREAACMAVLGALSRDGVAITLPRVTGAGSIGGVFTGPL